MSENRRRAQFWRPLAERVVNELPHEPDCWPDLGDIITSIVRQWLTFDGHAAVLDRNAHYFLRLLDDPNTGLRVKVGQSSPEPGFRMCLRDWEIEDESLGGILTDLNLGQCAVVTNRQGREIRVSVDPHTRNIEFDEVEPKQTENTPRRAYRKIALDHLEHCFGDGLSTEHRNDLANSLARQWITHSGRAMILTATHRFRIVMTEQPGGRCKVDGEAATFPLGADLQTLGLDEAERFEVIHRLNLGQAPEVNGPAGRVFRLTADPDDGSVNWELIEVTPPEPWFRVIAG